MKHFHRSGDLKLLVNLCHLIVHLITCILKENGLAAKDDMYLECINVI